MLIHRILYSKESTQLWIWIVLSKLNFLISPNKRYEEITVLGRSGSLHETFDDYESYDLPVENITIPYDRLREVKQWLRGRGQLITHNDYNTYRDVICMMDSPTEFENEWGFSIPSI